MIADAAPATAASTTSVATPAVESSSDVCAAWTVCAAGTFVSAAGTATTDTICTPCDAVADAASVAASDQADAVLTCISAGSSRVDACTAATWNNQGTGADDQANPPVAATSDVCTACTVCAAGTFTVSACSATADAVCTSCTVVAEAVGSDTWNVAADDANYTCVSAASSRVNFCRSGFFRT